MVDKNEEFTKKRSLYEEKRANYQFNGLLECKKHLGKGAKIRKGGFTMRTKSENPVAS